MRGFFIFGAFALIFALDLSTINPELSDLSGDSARYLLLAKSIATGRGCREIEKPAEPPHAEYMPGLPVLLAPIYHFWPDNLQPMKFLVALFALGSCLFFYLFLYRETVSSRILLALTFAMIPFLFRLQTQVLSDFPHLSFILLAFFWFEKSRDQPERKISSWVIAGFLVALAFYFRQLALIAFAAGFLAIVLTNKLRRLKIFLGYSLGFALPALIWELRNFLISGAVEPSYGRKLFFAQASNPFAGTLTLGGLIARMARRASFFSLRLEKDILIGSDWSGLKAIWIVLLALLVIGLGYELIRKKNVGAIYFLPYLAAVASWEGWVPRYLLPLLPLSVFFIYRGLGLVISAVGKNKNPAQYLAASFISVWLIFNFTRSLPVIIFQHTPQIYPPGTGAEEKEAVALIGQKDFASYPEAWDWRIKGEQYLTAKSGTYYHFFAMAEWSKNNLKPDQVVVCRKPTLFAWQSGVKSIQFPPELNVDKFLAEVKKRGGNYILIEEISPELRPVLFGFLQSRPQHFEKIKKIGQTSLLKIN